MKQLASGYRIEPFPTTSFNRADNPNSPGFSVKRAGIRSRWSFIRNGLQVFARSSMRAPRKQPEVFRGIRRIIAPNSSHHRQEFQQFPWWEVLPGFAHFSVSFHQLIRVGRIFRRICQDSGGICAGFSINAQVYQYIIMWGKAHDLLVLNKGTPILTAVGRIDPARPACEATARPHGADRGTARGDIDEAYS
jgi:hypothetical protein